MRWIVAFQHGCGEIGFAFMVRSKLSDPPTHLGSGFAGRSGTQVTASSATFTFDVVGSSWPKRETCVIFRDVVVSTCRHRGTEYQ